MNDEQRITNNTCPPSAETVNSDQSTMNNYAKQNRNENSHPALKIFKCWVPQFCIFNFDFCILKLTNQFESIMQNKAKLLNAQMNVSKVLTKDYENERLRRGCKNKAK